MTRFVHRAGRGEAARGFDAVERRVPVKSAVRSCPPGLSNVRVGWQLLSEARAFISHPMCLFPHPGFKEQIYDVYRYLPPATQVVLISATLPHEILEMTNKFMTDPIRILVKR